MRCIVGYKLPLWGPFRHQEKSLLRHKNEWVLGLLVNTGITSATRWVCLWQETYAWNLLEWNKFCSTMSLWPHPLRAAGLRGWPGWCSGSVIQLHSMCPSTLGWQSQGLGENVALIVKSPPGFLQCPVSFRINIYIYYFGEKNFPCMSYSIFWEENTEKRGHLSFQSLLACTICLFLKGKQSPYQEVVTRQSEACRCVVEIPWQRLRRLQQCHFSENDSTLMSMALTPLCP